MRICLIAPFFSGSHRRWAEGFQRSSTHEVKLLTLSGRYWKWRMHGGAISLAKRLLALPDLPDLILTTDMLDVATFAALIRHKAAHIPIAVYFHENQLTYPWSPTDRDVDLKRDRHYSWLNYTTALTADRVFFNSDYHKKSFLDELPLFLKAYPDHQEMAMVERIREKSEVLYLGMDLSELTPPEIAQKQPGSPALLWNHRWEYDKNPEGFFQLCYALQKQGVDFKLIVLGEQFKHSPAIFKEAKERLASHILHWGFAQSKTEYQQWLWRADILPVTGVQDFFGGSVVEAIYCNTYPLLPNRLAYPEHIPALEQSNHLYESLDDLPTKTAAIIAKISNQDLPDFQKWVSQYDWPSIIPRYDFAFQQMTKNS